MHKRQLEIGSLNQKQGNLNSHYYEVYSIGEKKEISAISKTSKPHLFDRLNNVILDNYREVFNAWNPAKSKIFIYLNAAFDRALIIGRNSLYQVLLPEGYS